MMTAGMSGDLKGGCWGTQLNGLTWDDGLYTGYPTYNNWAKMSPSPLGAKSFAWGFNGVNMNPLMSQQPSAINCFQSPSQSMGSSSLVPTSMGGTLGSTAPCPYPAPTPSYMYSRDQASSMSSSIASLRLKAKSLETSTLPYPSVSPRVQNSLSDCQYSMSSDRPAAM